MNRRVQPTADVKVSAVIPFFNDGSVIEDALASVQRQSRPVDEIVVVDDGSTDSFSLSVLDRLEGSDIAVIRQANGGPGSARNLGVAHTEGDALLFLDSDDTVAEGHVELALATLAQAPGDVGFLYPDLRFVGNEDRLVIMPPYNLYLLLHRNFCGTGGLVDRAVFESGFQFRTEGDIGHEDWDFFVTLGLDGIFGQPLHGTPLRYRRWGYSRSDGVTQGASGLAATRHHHAELDRSGRLLEIKREWAPALSVIVPASAEGVVADQSCDDFELVARPPDAVAPARGRWVLMLEAEGLVALGDRTCVERVLRLASDLSPPAPIALYAPPADGEGWHPTASEGRTPCGVVAEGHFYLDWSRRFDAGAAGVGGFCAYLSVTAPAAVPWAYGRAPVPDGAVPLSAFRPPRPPPEPPQGDVENTASEVERGFRHHEARPLYLPVGSTGRLPQAPDSSPDGLGALIERAWGDWMPARSVELVLVVDVFGEATLETSARPITAAPAASSRHPARLPVGFIWTQPFPGTACLSSLTDESSGRATYRVSPDAAPGEVVLGFLPVDLLPGRVPLERSLAACLGAVAGPRQVTPPQLSIASPEVYVEPSESPLPIRPAAAAVPPEKAAGAAQAQVSRPRFPFRHRKEPGGIGP